jgi:hypothetical protein
MDYFFPPAICMDEIYNLPRDVFVDCKQKQSLLPNIVVSIIILTILVCILIFATSSTTQIVSTVICVLLIISMVAGYFLIPFYYGREWDVVDTQINSYLKNGVDRSTAIENYVKKTQSDAQISAMKQQANAQSLMATAQTVNTAANIYSMFGKK